MSYAPSMRASNSLGFNVRRYRGKLLIKPSKAAIRRIRERLRTELRSLRGSQRRGGDPQAQPDHPQAGPTTTGRTVQAENSDHQLDQYLCG